MSAPRWPKGLSGISFGADYTPEQWPPATWREDVRLAVEAGVDVFAVGVFAWAALEPREGEYTWDWLDEVLDLLGAAGIRVALGTATASPPPWLTTKHPEILPRDREGRTLSPGARQAYAVSHPVWRRYATGIAARVAERYGRHPALALWHIDNEMAAHVPLDYSDAAADAFRDWLQRRYGTIDELNRAWGTAFWSQRYSRFAEILPPRLAPTTSNPTQEVDFRRFSSDAWREWCAELIAAVRPHSPGVPATTNLLPTMGSDALDLFSWRETVDLIAIDHYPVATDADLRSELSLSGDLARALARGGPWMLAEHAPSAVNWQEVNLPKSREELFRDAFTHVARGADAIMFFQWRQSVAGAERFHSALVPHAGTDSAGWRRVRELGSALDRCHEIQGTRVRARAALVMDYESWWTTALPSSPTTRLRYPDQLRALYASFWRQNITVDLVGPEDPLDAYDVIVVPTLAVSGAAFAGALAAAAHRGARILVTPFSGVVDADVHVHLGGYPGAFRDLLGVRSDEFMPLLDDEVVLLDDGNTGRIWTENVVAEKRTDVETAFASGRVRGFAALTRRRIGSGSARYLATVLDAPALDALVARLCAEVGIGPEQPAPVGVETVVRHGEKARFVFALNHTDREAVIAGGGRDLLTQRAFEDDVSVPPGGLVVLRRTVSVDGP